MVVLQASQTDDFHASYIWSSKTYYFYKMCLIFMAILKVNLKYCSYENFYITVASNTMYMKLHGNLSYVVKEVFTF